MRFLDHLIRHHTIRNLIIWLSLALLTSCADLSGITPSSEPLDPAKLAAGQNLANAGRVQWPDQNWWTACHDPQLNRLVDQAVANSPQLQTARVRIALAQAIAQSNASTTGPQASLDGSANRDRFTALQFIPAPWAGSTYWNNSVAASLSWNLDLWGRQKDNWLASLDEASAAAAETEEIRIQLENAIVRSYLRLALAYDHRDIAQARLEDLKEKLAIEKQGERAGLGTQLSISDAEDPLPAAQASLIAAEENIAHLKNELAALSGAGPGSMDNLTRPEPVLSSPVGLPDRLPAHLLGRRPDISAARWWVEASAKRIHAARTAFYPDINLSALAGFQAIGFTQWLTQAALMTAAGPAISLPLFDSGKRRADLSAATASYDIAVSQYNQTLVMALRDVSDQLVAYQSAAKQEIQAEAGLQIARDKVDMASDAYRAGLADYRVVLAAQENMLTAKDTLDAYRAHRMDIWARLMLALGGGNP